MMLTHTDLKNLKARAIAQGWEPLEGSNSRAYVRRNGERIELRSYDTLVFSYNWMTGEILRHWGGYSATTLRHVERFMCWLQCRPYRRNATYGKANWEATPLE